MRNTIKILCAAAWKDLQVIFRDRSFLVVVIFLPMVFSMMFGYMNQQMSQGGTEGVHFPVVVVNQDQKTFGNQIVDILKSISVLKITILNDPAQAAQQVRDSQVMAAIFIPATLTENVQSYTPSEVEVLVDPTQLEIASKITDMMHEVIAPIVVQGEVSYAVRTLLSEVPMYQQADEQTRQALAMQSFGVEMSQVQKMQADPWVKVESKTASGEDLVLIPNNMFAMFTPGFTVLFAFFVVSSMASELLREKREGSMRRLIASPMPRWTIIGGKMLAYLVLVIVQVLLIFGSVNLLFGMPIGNYSSGLVAALSSASGLLLVTVALGLAATGLGVLVAALARSDRQADSIGMLLGFVLGALGGCFLFGSGVPLYKSGGMIEVISRLTPQANALMAYEKLINQNAGLVVVLPQVGILTGMALLFMLIATWRLKWE